MNLFSQIAEESLNNSPFFLQDWNLLSQKTNNNAILYNATEKNDFGCLECILIGPRRGKTYSLQCSFTSPGSKACSCIGFQQECDCVSFPKICSKMLSCLKEEGSKNQSQREKEEHSKSGIILTAF